MANYPYYNRLCTCSKRYWHKLANNPKKLKKATFRSDLVMRLSQETGKNITTVWVELFEELHQWVKDQNKNI